MKLRFFARLVWAGATLVFAESWAFAQESVQQSAQESAEESAEGGLQDTASLDAEARGLFLAGQAAFDGGRYEEALGYFERAHDLSERPQLLFNIGHTASLLGNHGRALEAFDAYVDELPDAPNVEAVRTRAARLRERLADASTAPADPSPLAGELAGEPEAPPESGAGSAGPWVLIGSGGLLTVGGAVLLALAGSSASAVDNAEEGTPWSVVEGDYDRAQTFRISGAIIGAVGLAVLAAGLGWSIASRNRDFDVEVGLNGISLRGRF